MGIKQSLKSLLEEDALKTHSFEDEYLASSLYFTSLSTSLRSLANMGSEQRLKATQDNDWLVDDNSFIKNIPAINSDVLTNIIHVEGLKSMDAIILDTRSDQLHYIFEFKNCDRRTLYNAFLDTTGDDGILEKLKGSKKINNDMIIIEGVDCIIERMHVIIVYGGKNNMVSGSVLSKPQKSITEKNIKNKQSRASTISFCNHEKRFYEKENMFNAAVKNLNFAHCKKGLFSVSGRPDYYSEKPLHNIRYYSLFNATEFLELINNGFFVDTEWGIYTPYLKTETKTQLIEIEEPALQPV